jgi:uncharacterized protein YqfA (UPF0365 family)
LSVRRCAVVATIGAKLDVNQGTGSGCQWQATSKRRWAAIAQEQGIISRMQQEARHSMVIQNRELKPFQAADYGLSE